jgi:hypothetical protein
MQATQQHSNIDAETTYAALIGSSMFLVESHCPNSVLDIQKSPIQSASAAPSRTTPKERISRASSCMNAAFVLLPKEFTSSESASADIIGSVA